MRKNVHHKLIQTFILFNLVMLAFYFSNSISLAEEPPIEAIKVGKVGLQYWTDTLSPQELFGISRPKYELTKAYLGVPYRQYCITCKALMNYKEGDTISSLITPIDVWIFPIMINNELIGALEVKKSYDSENPWKVSGIGQAGSDLIGLMKIRHYWPKSEGYDPLVVVYYPGGPFYFTMPQVDDYNLTEIIVPGLQNEGESHNKKYERDKYISLKKTSDYIYEFIGAFEMNAKFNGANQIYKSID